MLMFLNFRNNLFQVCQLIFEIRDKSEDLVQFQKDGKGISYNGKTFIILFPNSHVILCYGKVVSRALACLNSALRLCVDKDLILFW